MHTLARVETAEQRNRIFATLTARNRFVAFLRIGMPVLGLVIFAGLMLQLYIGSLGPDFGLANFTVDRGKLVVESPTYSGMSADGTSYAVTAAAARAPLARTDLIDLVDVVLTVRKPSGAVMTAATDQALFQTGNQQVSVEGITHVADDQGTHGTLAGVVANIPEETMAASGAVDITFSNGATLRADSMFYEGSDDTWHFKRATLVVPPKAGSAAATTTEAKP